MCSCLQCLFWSVLSYEMISQCGCLKVSASTRMAVNREQCHQPEVVVGGLFFAWGTYASIWCKVKRMWNTSADHRSRSRSSSLGRGQRLGKVPEVQLELQRKGLPGQSGEVRTARRESPKMRTRLRAQIGKKKKAHLGSWAFSFLERGVASLRQ